MSNSVLVMRRIPPGIHESTPAARSPSDEGVGRHQGPIDLPVARSYRGGTSNRSDKMTAAQVAGITTLREKALEDLPGREVLMLEVEYRPGEVELAHRHFAHAFVYVLEGSIVMRVKDGAQVTLKPGDTFYEGPEDIHIIGLNASKTERARFVVFLLKQIGNPAVVPVS